jgi:hypothetical protein
MSTILQADAESGKLATTTGCIPVSARPRKKPGET